jgi:RNA polymerase sigma factor (sigma-70 family)
MLVDLYPKFSAIAYGYANSTLDTQEDLTQDMVLACLDKAEKDPEFFNQNESYILHQGRLQAWHKMRDKQTFDRYQYYPVANDEGYTELDFVAGNDLSPEEALIHKQELEALVQAIDRLSGREKEVVTLAISGVSGTEIAKKLSISKQAVNMYKNRAAKKFRFSEVI